MGEIVSSFRGLLIEHGDISFQQTAFFRDDGIHLSKQDIDIWLYSIQDGQLCWLQA